MTDRQASRTAFALILAFLAARLVFMTALGLGRDEAYTLVASRKWALSYFDHPPLHQWLAHAAAIAFGENVLARLPFVVAFSLTGWLLFALTRMLYGPRAGLAALFALNVTPFFFASAGTWIVPDGPLLTALAAAGLALASISLEAPTEGRAWRLWIAVGLAFGLAGLSKYSAALTGLGAFGFFATGRSQRRWLSHPAPYVAVALALVLVSPVFYWNAEHGWASLRFQGGRGAPVPGAGVLAALAMALGEAGYLLPWLAFALVAAAILGWRAARDGDERARLLLWLAAPPILLFTLVPLSSGKGLPHWAMPGWFFLYPLLGEWLTRQGYGRRAAAASAAALAVIAFVAVTQTQFAWIERLAGRPLPDPTLELLSWAPIRDAPALANPPAFVATTKWWEAGDVGVALGPETPIFVFSEDPRGIAFLHDGADFIGKDGVIIAEKRRLPYIEGPLSAYFQRLDPPQSLWLGRYGLAEQELVLVRAHGLTRAFPLPYPLGRL